MDDVIIVRLSFEKTSDLAKAYLHLKVNNELDLTIVEMDSNDWKENIFATNKKGKLEIELIFNSRVFSLGKHRISIGLASEVLPGFQILSAQDVAEFEIERGLFLRDKSRIALSSYIPVQNFQFICENE
jgi:hypothetical protein